MPSSFATLAVHAGSDPDPATGAVIQPISVSTTFKQVAAGEPVGLYEYSRSDNPNRASFEAAAAALERGKYALAYSSGSATTANILQALASHKHVVSIGDVYGGTHRYFTGVAHAHGVEVTFTHDIANELRESVGPNTRLVWVESPSNPTLGITDIKHIAEIVRELREAGQDIHLVVDNTFLSPYLCNPLSFGADIVMHSVTKYINGHSDVVMGLAVTNDVAIHERLRFLQNALGAVPSPFDCWLAHRGMKTLHLRARASSINALAIAKFLESEVGRRVVSVSYPGLPSHPGYKIVQKQHRDGLGGGMISFRIRGGNKEASNFCTTVKLFTLAESLGGVESLCEVPAAMTHAGIPLAARETSGVHDNVVRLSVGIEDAEDLVADVRQALEAVVPLTIDFPNGHTNAKGHS